MQIQLKNVRFTYVNTLKSRSFDGSPEAARYSVTLLLEKDSEEQKAIEDAIGAVAEEKWGKAAKGTLKKLSSENRMCLKDGNDKLGKDGEVLEGFEDHFSVAASNKEMPHTLNKYRQVVTLENAGSRDEDHRGPSSGDYGAALIRIWAQDNKYGKRINAQLDAIMFIRPGDPLGGTGGMSAGNAVSGFENMGLGEEDKSDALANLFQ